MRSRDRHESPGSRSSNTSRRKTPLHAWLAAWLLATAAAADLRAVEPNSAERSAERPPNVLLIIADDQGWGDLSLHGNANIRTPRIDSLGRDGAQFNRFFVSPVCSPTRASLLTGRYHLRCGVTNVTRGGERLNLDEVTVADLFRASGYATGAFGKWHNGSQYPYHPNGRGFDEFYGFCCGHWGDYFAPLLDHNGREVRGKGYISDDFTNHAIDFISQHGDKPFFCYVAYNTPHSPMQVPDEFFDSVASRELTMRHFKPADEDPVFTQAALAMCENLDWNVGRMLDKLDELNLTRDTIVLYMSDNGPNSWRWNGEMKGRKGSADEGGVRSPLLVRWPARIAPGTRVAPIASHVDLLPTLVDLCGIDVQRSPRRPQKWDGVSLKRLLVPGDSASDGSNDRSRDWPERMIFSTWANKWSVRTDRYRADVDGLYDMRSDPQQRNNLAREEPATHAKLIAALTQWKSEMLAERDKDQPDARPYPVGHADAPLTVLPAQDAEFHGEGLRFSAGPPNASWMTGWTNRDAYPTWNVDVLTAGKYEVTIKYTCAEDAVGTQLELRAFRDNPDGDAEPVHSTRGPIGESFDPPLEEAPDRIQRVESYDKEFRRTSLGEVRLDSGRQTLALQAIMQSGKALVDLRQIELRRTE